MGITWKYAYDGLVVAQSVNCCKDRRQPGGQRGGTDCGDSPIFLLFEEGRPNIAADCFAVTPISVLPAFQKFHSLKLCLRIAAVTLTVKAVVSCQQRSVLPTSLFSTPNSPLVKFMMSRVFTLFYCYQISP